MGPASPGQAARIDRMHDEWAGPAKLAPIDDEEHLLEFASSRGGTVGAGYAPEGKSVC